VSEKIAYHNQREIGYIGLALLRQWLVGENEIIEQLYSDFSKILQLVEIDKQSVAILEGIRDGYDKWSKIYDLMPNILIDVEQPVVEQMLQGISGEKAIDIACGTGRCSSLLIDLGFAVTGVDLSKDMLKQAKRKSLDIDFHQIDINAEDLPFDKCSFDLATLLLALTHFKDISVPIQKMHDLLKPGGYCILSDIHPWIVELGGQADYIDEIGSMHFVRNYVHSHSKYIRAFNLVGFKIVDCQEPILEEEHIGKIASGFAVSKKTLVTALSGLPLALVWKLKKE